MENGRQGEVVQNDTSRSFDESFEAPKSRDSIRSPRSPREDDDAQLLENDENEIEYRDQVEVDVNGRRLLPLSEKYDDFERMTTLPAAAISILLSCGMITAVFMVPTICVDIHETEDANEENIPHQKCPIQAFSLLIYVHLVYWFIHLLIDPYLKAKHRRNRMKGYLSFYDNTKNIRRAPFYLVSIGNFGLLLSSTVLNDYCEAFPGDCDHRFIKVDWLRGLITLECLANITFFFYYIARVKNFNQEEPFPDCMVPEIMDAIGTGLVLKFPREDEPECLPEEETHLAGYSEAHIRRLCDRQAYIFGRTWKEEDKYVRIMQAEMISFFVTQLKRKNRKIVTLAAHLARFTDDVQGLVGRPIEAS